MAIIQKFKNMNRSMRKLYGPFLWMGFNCSNATEPLPVDSSLFIRVINFQGLNCRIVFTTPE